MNPLMLFYSMRPARFLESSMTDDTQPLKFFSSSMEKSRQLKWGISISMLLTVMSFRYRLMTKYGFRNIFFRISNSIDNDTGRLRGISHKYA